MQSPEKLSSNFGLSDKEDGSDISESEESDENSSSMHHTCLFEMMKRYKTTRHSKTGLRQRSNMYKQEQMLYSVMTKSGIYGIDQKIPEEFYGGLINIGFSFGDVVKLRRQIKVHQKWAKKLSSLNDRVLTEAAVTVSVGGANQCSSSSGETQSENDNRIVIKQEVVSDTENESIDHSTHDSEQNGPIGFKEKVLQNMVECKKEPEEETDSDTTGAVKELDLRTVSVKEEPVETYPNETATSSVCEKNGEEDSFVWMSVCGQNQKYRVIKEGANAEVVNLVLVETEIKKTCSKVIGTAGALATLATNKGIPTTQARTRTYPTKTTAFKEGGSTCELTTYPANQSICTTQVPTRTCQSNTTAFRSVELDTKVSSSTHQKPDIKMSKTGKYFCQHCTKSGFSSKSEEADHEKSVHMSGISCYFCGLTLASVKEGLEHVAENHCKVFRCLCNLQFPSEVTYMRHVRQSGHPALKIFEDLICYVCLLCNKTSHCKLSFILHCQHRGTMALCSGLKINKSYDKCNVCNLVFFDRIAKEFHQSEYANLPNKISHRPFLHLYSIKSNEYDKRVYKVETIKICGKTLQYNPDKLLKCFHHDHAARDMLLSSIFRNFYMMKWTNNLTQNVVEKVFNMCISSPGIQDIVRSDTTCIPHFAARSKTLENVNRVEKEVDAYFQKIQNIFLSIAREMGPHHLPPNFEDMFLRSVDLSMQMDKKKQVSMSPENSIPAGGNTIVINNQKGGGNSIILGGSVNQVFISNNEITTTPNSSEKIQPNSVGVSLNHSNPSMITIPLSRPIDQSMGIRSVTSLGLTNTQQLICQPTALGTQQIILPPAADNADSQNGYQVKQSNNHAGQMQNSTIPSLRLMPNEHVENMNQSSHGVVSQGMNHSNQFGICQNMNQFNQSVILQDMYQSNQGAIFQSMNNSNIAGVFQGIHQSSQGIVLKGMNQSSQSSSSSLLSLEEHIGASTTLASMTKQHPNIENQSVPVTKIDEAFKTENSMFLQPTIGQNKSGRQTEPLNVISNVATCTSTTTTTSSNLGSKPVTSTEIASPLKQRLRQKVITNTASFDRLNAKDCELYKCLKSLVQLQSESSIVKEKEPKLKPVNPGACSNIQMPSPTQKRQTQMQQQTNGTTLLRIPLVYLPNQAGDAGEKQTYAGTVFVHSSSACNAKSLDKQKDSVNSNSRKRKKGFEQSRTSKRKQYETYAIKKKIENQITEMDGDDDETASQFTINLRKRKQKSYYEGLDSNSSSESEIDEHLDKDTVNNIEIMSESSDEDWLPSVRNNKEKEGSKKNYGEAAVISKPYKDVGVEICGYENNQQRDCVTKDCLKSSLEKQNISMKKTPSKYLESKHNKTVGDHWNLCTEKELDQQCEREKQKSYRSCQFIESGASEIYASDPKLHRCIIIQDEDDPSITKKNKETLDNDAENDVILFDEIIDNTGSFIKTGEKRNDEEICASPGKRILSNDDEGLRKKNSREKRKYTKTNDCFVRIVESEAAKKLAEDLKRKQIKSQEVKLKHVDSITDEAKMSKQDKVAKHKDKAGGSLNLSGDTQIKSDHSKCASKNVKEKSNTKTNIRNTQTISSAFISETMNTSTNLNADALSDTKTEGWKEAKVEVFDKNETADFAQPETSQLNKPKTFFVSRPNLKILKPRTSKPRKIEKSFAQPLSNGPSLNEFSQRLVNSKQLRLRYYWSDFRLRLLLNLIRVKNYDDQPRTRFVKCFQKVYDFCISRYITDCDIENMIRQCGKEQVWNQLVEDERDLENRGLTERQREIDMEQFFKDREASKVYRKPQKKEIVLYFLMVFVECYEMNDYYPLSKLICRYKPYTLPIKKTKRKVFKKPNYGERKLEILSKKILATLKSIKPNDGPTDDSVPSVTDCLLTDDIENSSKEIFTQGSSQKEPVVQLKETIISDNLKSPSKPELTQKRPRGRPKGSKNIFRRSTRSKLKSAKQQINSLMSDQLINSITLAKKGRYIRPDYLKLSSKLGIPSNPAVTIQSSSLVQSPSYSQSLTQSQLQTVFVDQTQPIVNRSQAFNNMPIIIQPTHQQPTGYQQTNQNQAILQTPDQLVPVLQPNSQQTIMLQPSNHQKPAIQSTSQQQAFLETANQLAPVFLPTSQQTVLLQPANQQASILQPITQQQGNLQATNLLASGLQSMNQQTLMYQPSNQQTALAESTNQLPQYLMVPVLVNNQIAMQRIPVVGTCQVNQDSLQASKIPKAVKKSKGVVKPYAVTEPNDVAKLKAMTSNFKVKCNPKIIAPKEVASKEINIKKESSDTPEPSPSYIII